MVCLRDIGGRLTDGLAPDDAAARALFSQDSFAEAEPLFRQHAAAHPQDAVARYNLGVTLEKLGRTEEAIAVYREAIALNPGFADPYNNLASCLNELNLIAQARQGFAIAHVLAPDDPVPVLNEGIAALTLGDYASGWRGFAARWRLPSYAKFKRVFSQPAWRGEDVRGKTLFLYAEQGFGDSLQMARFIPLLETRGARIVVEMPPALSDLMRTVSPTAQIIVKGDPIPPFDMACAMMDIPEALSLTLDTLPAPTSYLCAQDGAIAVCRAALPPDGRRKIGLSWAGRPTHQNDHNRSIALSAFEPLLAREDLHFVSLQRVVPDRDRAFLLASRIQDWGSASPDFAATAAMMMNMDIIVTVDTALAHLAGALGKPAWILLPYSADWRWLLNREDSPWYPKARLFRQPERRNWASVITKVATDL